MFVTGGCAVHWTVDTGYRILDIGHWTMDTGYWTLECGQWTGMESIMKILPKNSKKTGGQEIIITLE